MDSNQRTLTIRFAGMCLLVRGADHRLRTLLPSMRAHDHAGSNHGHHRNGAAPHDESDRHRAVLLFDPRLAVADPPGGGDERRPTVRDLAGGMLSFPGLGAEVDPDTVKQDLASRGVADLTELFGVRVPAGTGESVSATGVVIARVDVPAGKTSGHDPGVVWNLGSRKEKLAVWVEWTVPVGNGPVRMVLERPTSSEEWLLNPNPGGPDTVHIYHDPDPELGTRVPPRDHGDAGETEAPHFAAFFDLVQPPVPAADRIPRRSAPEIDQQALAPRAILGSRVTCVIASAESG
jgi:hypothetical protein